MGLSIISLLIPILLVVLIVLIVSTVKAQPKEGGEEMIKKVYIYLVLFATLMMTIGGSVAIFMAIADIVAPASSYHQTFDDYRRGMDRSYYPEAEREDEKLSEAELRERYDAMLVQQKQNQIERAKNSLIKSLGWIVVPLPVFIYFQRRLAGENGQKSYPVEDD